MYRCDKYGKRIRLYAKRVEMGTANMNKKIIKTASVIAVGAGAAALYKAKFAKDNNSDNQTQGCTDSGRKRINVNVMEKAAVNILIIKIRNLGSMKKQ